jgi:hypothetical protein
MNIFRRLVLALVPTLFGVDVRAGVAPTSFCFGDGTEGWCPCLPAPLFGATGHGCPNSFTSSGAILSFVGPQFIAVLGGNSASYGLMLKGNATLGIPGAPSGDGIRCVDGQLIRFGGHNAGTYGAPLGTWTYPNAVQTVSIAVATGQVSGQNAYYQLYYRNVAPICNPSTTNMTNAIGISW